MQKHIFRAVFLVVFMLVAARSIAAEFDSSPSISKATDGSPSVYVYLIDMSTSMQWIFEDVKEIVKKALRNTNPQDSVTLILFGDTVSTLASYESMNEVKKDTICKYLDSVHAESVYTNIGLALKKGVEHLHQRFLNKPAKEYICILVTDGKDHPPPTYVRDHTVEQILTKFPDFLPGADWSFRYIVLEGQFDPELLSCVKRLGESFFDVEKIAKVTRLTEVQIIQGILEEPQNWVAFPVAVVDLVGQVELRKADEDEWVPIPEDVRQRIAPGDAIRTGGDSRANITLGETGQIGAYENTIIRLEQSHMDPATRSTEIKIDMEQGVLWNALKVLKDKPLKYDVVTPLAITGVRGTNFMVAIDPQESKQNVAVIDGTVEISSLETDIFQKFNLSAGASTVILSGERPTPPQPLSEKILSEWEKWEKALIQNKSLKELNFLPVHVVPGTMEIVMGPLKPAKKEVKEFPLQFDREYFGTDVIVAEALIELPPGAEIRAWVEDTANPSEKTVMIELTGKLFLKYAGQDEYLGKVRLSCADPIVSFKHQYLDLLVIHDPPTFSDKVRSYPPVAKGLLALAVLFPMVMTSIAIWTKRFEVQRWAGLIIQRGREKIRLIKLVHLLPSRPCGQLVLCNDIPGVSQRRYDLAAVSRSCRKMVLPVGSDSSNAISLCEGVEAFHCVIWASRRRNPTKMFIQPCSKGNVAVNSEKVEEIRRLNDKDIIEIGRYVFKFLDTQFRQQIKVFLMNGKTSKGMLEYWDLSQSIFFMIQTDKEKEKFCTVRFDEVAYVHFYRDQSEREQSYVSSLFRRRKAAREACIKVILKNGKKLSGFIRNKDGPGPGEGPGLFLIPNEEKSKIQYTYIPRNGIKRIIE